MGLFEKLFGTRSQRELKKIQPTVDQILALEEPYKEVFSLRVFGELPFDRIGAIFGHNAAWARVTYYRAKTRIQTMLEQRK